MADLARMGDRPVLALGVFDGLHLGHQAVIEAAGEVADEVGGPVVVTTFDPHPAALFAPGGAPERLTSRRHHLRLLERMGVSRCIVLPFDRGLASLLPLEFLDALCAASSGLAGIVTGNDYTFGRGRSGTIDDLAAHGAARGYRTVAVPPVGCQDGKVSSTRLRRALKEGDLALAAALLGRRPSALGEVVHGDGRGRTLGFPTANVMTGGELLPPPGVYVVEVEMDGGQRRRGVANVGPRPTVDGGEAPSLEVHVLDFEGDLYGQDLEVAWLARLRGQERFAGLDALAAQIADDAAQARAWKG